jgi:sulfofructose kinase
MEPVIFVGAATFDAIAVVERYPEPDERVIAQQLVYAGGGPAATAAVVASRLGVPAAFIGPVGADREGQNVLAGLADEGVDTAGVQVDPGRPTQGSLIVCSASDSTRAISTRQVPPFRLSPENAERIRAAAWLHVDHLGWPAVEEALLDVPEERRPRVVVDAGNPPIGDQNLCDPARITVYAPTREVLETQFPGPSLEDSMRTCPADVVVATSGDKGSFGRDEEGHVHAASGFRIDTFGSSLGAGDVFHGALTVSLVRGMALPDALLFSNAVAALSCRGIDGRSAIPNQDETNQFIRSHNV